MKHNYMILMSLFACQGVLSSRITVVVPIMPTDCVADISDFLYSLSRTANFHELEVLIFKNSSVRLKHEDILPYVLNYSNIVYFPLEREYTMGEILNVGVKLSHSTYLIKGTVGNRYGLYFFELLARELDKNKNLGFVYSGVVLVEDNSRYFYQLYSAPTSKRLDLSLKDYRVLSAIMWRKSLHAKYGLFDESYAYLSDCEYWNRFPASKTNSLKIPEVLLSNLVEQEMHLEKKQEYERIVPTYRADQVQQSSSEPNPRRNRRPRRRVQV